eukprot:5091865-Lingulodinium_polyedra.AAC.1
MPSWSGRLTHSATIGGAGAALRARRTLSPFRFWLPPRATVCRPPARQGVSRLVCQRVRSCA